MCEYFGYRVEKLQRIRIMNIEIGDLEVGKYSNLTKEEYETLMRTLSKSSNQPFAEQQKKGNEEWKNKKE